MEKYKQLLDKLRNSELKSIEIPKEEFLAFREVLVKDEQFKHFRGDAQQGGNITFTYLQQPRS